MNYYNIFKEFKINYLTHFTSIYNLKSILENGILSVDYMDNHEIKYINTDKNRFDNQLDYISISTNSINKKMLYKKMCNNKENLNIWIILVLELNMLNDQNLDIYFCYKNAAASEINLMLKNEKEKLKTPFYINKFLISDDIQKEILVKDKIPLKYIKGIVVKNPNDRDIVNSILMSKNIKIPVICKKEMF